MRGGFVAALGAVVAGALVSVPVTADAAGGTLRVSQVTASARTSGAGTKVTVGIDLTNPAANTASPRKLLVFLGHGDDTLNLTRARTVAVAPGASRHLVLSALAGPKVAAGTYAVTVCLVRRAPGRCAVADRKVRVGDSGLSASESAVAFGAVPAASAPAEHVVQLINTTSTYTGRLRLALASTSPSGFSASAPCVRTPHGLAPGATCALSVRFTPSGRGPVSDRVTVTARRTAPVTIPLSATVQQAAGLVLTAGPAFAPTQVGDTSAPSAYTVSNPGDVPAGAVTPVVTGDFALGNNTCAGALAPGASCTVAVHFKPTARGARTGSLSVSATPGGSAAATLSGTGLAPAALSVNPASQAFGGVLVNGTGAPQSFVVTNGGDVVTGVPTPSVTGPFAISTNGCAAALAPGATCTVAVVFKPTARGAASGQLSIASTPGGTAVAALSGTGLAPASLSVTPTSQSYGGVLLNATSAPQTFTLTNGGDVDSGVPAASVTGPFAIATNGCTAALAPAGSCSVTVVFKPTTRGAATGSLSLTATPGGTATAGLSGTGQAPAALSADQSSLDFGQQLIGSQTTKEIKVSNGGDVPTTVGVAKTGDADFTVTNGCTGNLAGGATCSVFVTFTATTRGARTGTVTIAGPGGPFQIPLTGTVLAPASLYPTPSFTFGGLTIGDSKQFDLSLENRGDVATGTISFTLADPDHIYAVDLGNCPATLAPGASCVPHVTVTPTSTNSQTGTITWNATPGGPATTSLSTSGSQTPANLVPSPTRVDFGYVAVNESPTVPVQLTNNGQRPTTVTFTAPSGFTVTGGDACPNLTAGASCTVQVAATSTTLGNLNGSLRVDYLSTYSGTAKSLSVPLTATIVPLSVSPASADLGTIARGSTKSASFTLTNQSSAPVNWASQDVGALDGDPDSAANFGATCPASIGIGQSCTVTVGFVTSSASHTGARRLTLDALQNNVFISAPFVITANIT